MCRIEDALKVLEEGIVDDLQSDAEVVAESMENAPTLHLWWI
jgi:hypothetical protein